MDSFLDSERHARSELGDIFATLPMEDSIIDGTVPLAGTEAPAAFELQLPSADALEPVQLPLTAKAPTRALENPPTPEASERYTTFTVFPELPTEIRLKIWRLLFRPQILILNYNAETLGEPICVYSYQARQVTHMETWEFFNGPDDLDEFKVGYKICQESRYEAHRSGTYDGYKPMSLTRNVLERRWFNYDVDTLLLVSNLGYRAQVHPPDHAPRGYCECKHLAIGWELWQNWEFTLNYGSDYSSDGCLRWENAQSEWKNFFFEWLGNAQKVELVQNSYRLRDFDSLRQTDLEIVQPVLPRQKEALEAEIQTLIATAKRK